MTLSLAATTTSTRRLISAPSRPSSSPKPSSVLLLLFCLSLSSGRRPTSPLSRWRPILHRATMTTSPPLVPMAASSLRPLLPHLLPLLFLTSALQPHPLFGRRSTTPTPTRPSRPALESSRSGTAISPRENVRSAWSRDQSARWRLSRSRSRCRTPLSRRSLRLSRPIRSSPPPLQRRRTTGTRRSWIQRGKEKRRRMRARGGGEK